MKNIAIYLCFILVVLTSCQTVTNKNIQNSPEAVNQATDTQVTESIDSLSSELVIPSDDSTSIKGIISLIPESYHNEGQFVMCMQSNVDMCMSENAHSQGMMPNCDDMILEVNRKSCMETQAIQNAKESKNMEACDTLDVNKASCEFEVALGLGFDTLDTSVCDQLKESFITPCFNQIIAEKAKQNVDASICDEIQNFKPEFAARDTADIELCIQEVQFIEDENNRIAEELRRAEEALPAIAPLPEEVIITEGN